MEVKIQLDANALETKIVIYTKEINEEITRMANALMSGNGNIITAYDNDKVVLLNKSDIYRFYAEKGKVYVDGNEKTFTIKKRLYELEEMLINSSFIRISNYEIANFDKIYNLDFSKSGTITIKYKNQTISYVSRRNVDKIKQYLNLR